MLQYLRSSSNDSVISTQEKLRTGSWVRCERPSDEEVAQLLMLGLDEDLISDALDPHEVPRIEFDDEWTYLNHDIWGNYAQAQMMILMILPRQYYFV